MALPDINDIWSISEHNFNDFALQIFQFQVKNNPIYAEYVELIDQKPSGVEHYTQIPFLPISFFKTHKLVSSNFEPQATFESSSTTGSNTSKHYVKDLDLYHTNCLQIFEQQIGNLDSMEILGLLPSYLERQNSSLVSMVKYFMDYRGQEQGFYLNNHQDLYKKLQDGNSNKLLFGVSFALLDFAEKYNVDSEITIIATGGMKGRKTEMTKEEVYKLLQSCFPNAKIISEYGMTELLSQAYSDNRAFYTCPSWMKVLPRADNDPLSHAANGHTSALNIIDLANLNTCSFVATDDLGRVHSDGTFEVTGRMDHSDIRGCSLMVV
jgi:hypothetical protein